MLHKLAEQIVHPAILYPGAVVFLVLWLLLMRKVDRTIPPDWK